LAILVMMFYHHNCLLFIINLPVMDVHMLLKRMECEKGVWSKKTAKGDSAGTHEKVTN